MILDTLALLLASVRVLGVAAQPGTVRLPPPAPPAPRFRARRGRDRRHRAPAARSRPARRQVGARRGRAAARGAAADRRHAGQAAGRVRNLLLARRLAAGAARIFQGERIRVLTDGIGSIDVSNTSSDHAVTIDPLTAERIEVLRGPAVLLFGGQAIGGAVNVIDRRIPRVVPEAWLSHRHHRRARLGRQRALDRRRRRPRARHSGLVLHADGSLRKTGDLRAGGFVLSPGVPRRAARDRRGGARGGPCRGGRRSARARRPARQDPQQRRRAVDRRARAGADPRRFQHRRVVQPVRQRLWHPGPPGRRASSRGRRRRAEDEEEHGDVPVSINLRQKRFDLRGEYRLGSGFLERVAAARRRRRLQAHRVRRRRSRHRVRIRRRRRPPGIRPARPRRLERRQRRAIFDAQVRRRRRRGVPARQQEPASSGCSRCRSSTLGKLGLEGALRFERSHVESAPLGIERDFDARLGRGRRVLRSRAAGSGRHQPVAHRPRAVGRGAVLQRPAHRHPGVRDRRSRPRHRETSLGRRGLCPARPRRPRARPHRLRQPLRRLHL